MQQHAISVESLTRPSSCPIKPLVRLEDTCLSLSKREILRDVRLDLTPGEFVSVIGPSGCGKTTLLRLIGGLFEPTDGRILFDGRELRGPTREISVVFQDYAKALLPWRTASENVSLALEAAKVPRKDRAPIIQALLDKTGLGNHGQKFPGQMSGGMQQRLQIARSLAQEPKLLLMDEPFGALDAMTRQSLQDELLNILAINKATAFFVTHDLEEAIYLSDRVIGLLPHPGRIAEVFEVNLPRPRDQLETRESEEFLRLRRELTRFINTAEGHA
jgi:NitT/TauT family transport system ATP-binding protein